MLADEGAGPVHVVPFTGELLALGVIVVARVGHEARDFDVRERAAITAAVDRCAGPLELTRLADEASRGSALVGMLEDAVISTDADGVVTAWNSAAERIYGLAGADAVGRQVGELLTTEYPEGVDEAAAAHQVFTDGVWESRVRQTVGSGRIVDIDSRVVRVRDGAGRFLGLLAVNRDVTELVAVTASAERHSRFARELMDALEQPRRGRRPWRPRRRRERPLAGGARRPRALRLRAGRRGRELGGDAGRIRPAGGHRPRRPGVRRPARRTRRTRAPSAGAPRAAGRARPPSRWSASTPARAAPSSCSPTCPGAARCRRS